MLELELILLALLHHVRVLLYIAVQAPAGAPGQGQQQLVGSLLKHLARVKSI